MTNRDNTCWFVCSGKRADAHNTVWPAVGGMVGSLALAAMAMTARTAEAQSQRLQTVPYSPVKLSTPFWSVRQRVNREKTIPHLIGMCQREGRVRNMLRAAGQLGGGFEGTRRHDADLFKVIEAAAYTLVLHPDPQLEGKLDELIAAVAAAGRDDGYLHTYFQVRAGKDRRSTKLNLFAAGHLIDAGVTHYQATGKTTLLLVALRMADLIDTQYGLGKQIDVPSHPKLESALVRLADVTGTRRYVNLAAFFVNQRGQASHSRRSLRGVHSVDHVPLRELRHAEGHVIGSLFLFNGMFDVGTRTGDDQLLTACRRVFDDAVSCRMYITGAMGRQSDERFTEPYALNNRTSIGEGCQSATLIRFAHRFLLRDADARRADVIERVMYNNLAANVGLDGTTFYYHNRLSACPEDATGRPYTGIVTETDKKLMPRNCLDRQPWFKVPCCPPNVAMTIATIGQYAYTTSQNAVYVNQYLDSGATILLDGTQLSITQKTRYPWDGQVTMTVEPDKSPWNGTIWLRIPDWCRDLESTGGLYRSRRPTREQPWSVSINRQSIKSSALRRGYMAIVRLWKRGDIIELGLPMPILRVSSHPNVAVNRDRVAIQRGPIVYCVEAVDHDGRVGDIYLPAEAKLHAEHRGDFLGGVPVIEGTARRQGQADADDEPVNFLAVPYAVWANREVGEMDVWLRETAGKAASCARTQSRGNSNPMSEP